MSWLAVKYQLTLYLVSHSFAHLILLHQQACDVSKIHLRWSKALDGNPGLLNTFVTSLYHLLNNMLVYC